MAKNNGKYYDIARLRQELTCGAELIAAALAGEAIQGSARREHGLPGG